MRLTNEKRNLIKKELLIKVFQKERQELFELEQSFADTLYASNFDEEEIKLLDSSPEGWLPTSATIQFTPQGRHSETFHMTETRRFPSYLKPAYCAPYLGDLFIEDPLFKEWEKIDNRRFILRKDIEDFKAKVSSVLESCNTSAQLKKAWPEVFELVEIETPKKINTSVMPIVSDLNNLIQAAK